MASTASQKASNKKVSYTIPVLPRLVRFALLVVLDAATIWFLLRLVSLGYYPLAAAIFSY
jgi:hypothetical protein